MVSTVQNGAYQSSQLHEFEEVRRLSEVAVGAQFMHLPTLFQRVGGGYNDNGRAGTSAGAPHVFKYFTPLHLWEVQIQENNVRTDGIQVRVEIIHVADG